MPIDDSGTWNSLVSAPITMAALASSAASFTQILMLVANVTPDGGTIASYTTLEEVVDDTANLSTVAIAMATALFAQAAKNANGVVPTKVYIQGVNVVGSQTYVQALADAVASGADFFGIIADVRTPADQILIATQVETYAASAAYYLFITQDDDADWKTTGIPAAWSAVTGYEWTAIAFHDDNDNDASSARLDCALMGNRMGWDPDVQSAAWNCDVAGVAALTTPLTSAQKGFLVANYASAALTFFDADFWVHAAKTLAGRPIEHVVTAVWIRRRMQEAGAAALAAASARGEKIAVDPEGQGILRSVFEGVAIRAVRAKHLTTTDATKPPYRIRSLSISAADITGQTLRFTFEAQFASGVRSMSIPVNLSPYALS